MSNEQFLSVQDIVRLTTLKKSTVYNEMDRGKLRAFRLGRRRLIRASDYKTYLKLHLNEEFISTR